MTEHLPPPASPQDPGGREPARDVVVIAHSDATARDLARGMRIATAIGIILLVACIPGWIFVPKSFYPSYLFAWLFWLGVSLGGLAAVMLHHLTGGEWGYFVRRFGEAASMVLPVMLVLFIPVFFGMRVLYPWHPKNPEYINPFVLHRANWFNPLLWSIRWAITMVVFILWAWGLRRNSLRFDRDPSPRFERTMYRLSASGMVIYFVLMSLASVDWIMSREPEWRSTIFGFIVIMGQAISGLCVLIIMLASVSRLTPFKERVGPNHFNDLGNLLLTCVILWAYCSFAQLLITYVGNSQGEITWYMPRTTGVWHALAAALCVFHFLVPFFLLLMRSIKRHVPAIFWVCVGLLIIRAIDVFWMTLPTGSDPDLPLPWTVVAMSIGSFIGVGGVWTAAFLWLVGGHPLMPMGESVPLRVHRVADPGTPPAGQHWNQHGSTPGTASAGPTA